MDHSQGCVICGEQWHSCYFNQLQPICYEHWHAMPIKFKKEWWLETLWKALRPLKWCRG